MVCLYIKNVDYWFIYKLNNFICGGWVSMIDRKFEVRNFIILLIKLMFEELDRFGIKYMEVLISSRN